MTKIRWHLDDLGWYQFEKLCQALLKASYGNVIEAWGGSKDFGRDAYYSGSLKLDGTRRYPGPFLFQVKFVEGANAAKAEPGPHLLTAIKKEVKRIIARQKAKQWSRIKRYVLMTNAPISATLRKEIKSILKEKLPKVRITCWDAQDIAGMLDNQPNIRMAFPQILGIADIQLVLSSIVNSAVLRRSELALRKSLDLAPIFVPTSAYDNALSVLSKRNFVVLTGPPEMGKSTIAYMIGLCKLSDEWEFHLCHTPKEVFEVSNHNKDINKVIVADDAFGATEFKPELALEWGNELDLILRGISKKVWLIFTSRPAPLKSALSKMHLEGKAEKFPEPGEVVVDASELTTKEKALMLYRHCKVERFSKSEKAIIKKHAKRIVNNKHFTPERIRRFATEIFPNLIRNKKHTKSFQKQLAKTIGNEIQKPTDRMSKSFKNLPKAHKTFLISLVDADSNDIRVSDAESAFYRHNTADEAESLDTIASELSGHFIVTHSDKVIVGSKLNIQFSKWNVSIGKTYSWIHPSWRDLIIEYLMKNKAARKRFLQKCSIEGIRLALSTAGGREGKRHFPLLKDIEDWKTLESNTKTILDKLDAEATKILLHVLSEAIKIGKRVLGRAKLSALNDYIYMCLVSIKKNWDNSKIKLDYQNLKSFYKLTILITPLAPGPHLDTTWKDLWENAEDELSDLEDDDYSFDSIHKFVSFARLVRKYEPRIAIKYGFPKSFLENFQNLLRNVFISDDTDWITEEEESDFEHERWGTYLAILRILKKMYKSQGKLINEAIEEVEHYVWRIESEMLEKFPGDPVDHWDEERESRDSEFDIDELFIDL